MSRPTRSWTPRSRISPSTVRNVDNAKQKQQHGKTENHAEAVDPDVSRRGLSPSDKELMQFVGGSIEYADRKSGQYRPAQLLLRFDHMEMKHQGKAEQGIFSKMCQFSDDKRGSRSDQYAARIIKDLIFGDKDLQSDCRDLAAQFTGILSVLCRQAKNHCHDREDKKQRQDRAVWNPSIIQTDILLIRQSK